MQIKDELLDIEGIKNSNKGLLDLFIRRTAVLTSTPEAMTELIIKDQWKRANQTASDKTNISEIDFPNLGCFYISKNKAKNKIKNTEKLLSEYETRLTNKGTTVEEKKRFLESLIQNIKIKTKTNEI